MLTRLRALKVDVDRLDDTIVVLDRDERAILGAVAASIRERVDQLEARAEQIAAGR